MSEQSPFRAVVVVIAVAFGAVLLVSGADRVSRDRIALNERIELLESLQTVMDRDLLGSTQTVELEVSDPELLGTRETLSAFIMLDRLEPKAVVLTSVAPDGYNAPIRLLIGIRLDGSISGVRVVDHRETPGLGDAIESEKSGWILQFNNATLDSPKESDWQVEKDGGVFDSLTGATVTPRAIVQAVHASLIYFARERDSLLAAAIGKAVSESNE